MGSILDCTADPDADEVDLSQHPGKINKPFHALSIKELAHNVKFQEEEDKNRYSLEKAQQALAGGVDADADLPISNDSSIDGALKNTAAVAPPEGVDASNVNPDIDADDQEKA